MSAQRVAKKRKIQSFALPTSKGELQVRQDEDKGLHVFLGGEPIGGIKLEHIIILNEILNSKAHQVDKKILKTKVAEFTGGDCDTPKLTKLTNGLEKDLEAAGLPEVLTRTRESVGIDSDYGTLLAITDTVIGKLAAFRRNSEDVVALKGKKLSLTPPEARILSDLVQNPGRELTKKDAKNRLAQSYLDQPISLIYGKFRSAGAGDTRHVIVRNDDNSYELRGKSVWKQDLTFKG